VFFSEEKNQKTFSLCARGNLSATLANRSPPQIDKSLLVLFFRKEHSLLPVRFHRPVPFSLVAAV
jgi:hypothetical protein